MLQKSSATPPTDLSFKERLIGLVIRLKTGSYKSAVTAWRKHKTQTLAQANETSLYRWDTEYSKIYFLSPPNKGKAITDNNPYVNLLDQEEFDLASEVYPYFDTPPTWTKSLYFKYFSSQHRETTGRADTFLARLLVDKKRMQTEASNPKKRPRPAPHKESDLAKLKDQIREFAQESGFPAMGVTKLDRRYIAEHADKQLPYDTLILLAHELPRDTVRLIPDNPPNAAFTSYRDGGNAVHKVADFIRSKGYDCITRVSSDGAIKYAPHAVNAGMGNYSTYGVAILPEVGTRTKMAAILIDAELPLDAPRDWNIEEFCSRCRSCQKACPAGAIPKDERRFRGMLKRQTYHQRCFEYMATAHECMECVRVCPFSMLGYEQTMNALPQYYKYNIERDQVDRNYWAATTDKESENAPENPTDGRYTAANLGTHRQQHPGAGTTRKTGRRPCEQLPTT